MGWRFLYYASDKRHWQCLTSSHLLLLHLPLWEHSGNQKGDKGPTEIDKNLTCPWYVQEYGTVETGAATAAHRGTASLINLSFARPCSPLYPDGREHSNSRPSKSEAGSFLTGNTNSNSHCGRAGQGEARPRVGPLSCAHPR